MVILPLPVPLENTTVRGIAVEAVCSGERSKSDLYIAIHSNKAGSESPRGTECYYYTSYSQPLAESLTRHVSSYFSNNVYSDGANCNRGAQYSYMWTTKQQDFPSVLIEMGFVSNYEDAMALANSTDQDGIAQAIVDGIKEYVTRSGVSSY
jgi:N-acetylmuramoyl-L-alanine amidase